MKIKNESNTFAYKQYLSTPPLLKARLEKLILECKSNSKVNKVHGYRTTKALRVARVPIQVL